MTLKIVLIDFFDKRIDFLYKRRKMKVKVDYVSKINLRV